MTRKRFLLALPVLAFVAGVAYVSQATETAGTKMTTAADKFLSSLTEDQQKKAQFAFDDKERTNWHFTPQQDKDRKSTRKGLRLEDMTPAQKDAARELLRCGTSESGFKSATTIMSLEAILDELEKTKTNVRNPEWYFFTIFGKPSKTGKWGWRIEGHHLCLNFTLEDGKIISATPAFFGANPATVTRGDRVGLQAIPEAEAAAVELFDLLDAEQHKVALQKQQFKEIPETATKPELGEPVGLPASKMTEKQRAVLTNLVEAYAHRMPPDIAAAELAEVKAAGIDKIYFAFARDDSKPGNPYTYRVHGPTFVIEFLNVQADGADNPANHIHSVWRNIKGDFGLTK
jgi:hypothetical protein